MLAAGTCCAHALLTARSPVLLVVPLPQQAPYPRDLPYLFFGEELLQLARMWLAGWNVYAPCAHVAFHLWSRAHRPMLPPHPEQRAASQRRVRDELVGKGGGSIAAVAAEATADAAKPTAATRSARTLAQFWEFCGVDFAAGTISERARTGGLPPDALLLSA